MKTKIVNIYPSMPITGVNPPIRSTVKRVTKSVSEIRTCLMARAIVEEVLPDGTAIRLNIGNYDKFSNEDTSNCACGNGNCSCGWKIQPAQEPELEAPVVIDSDKTSEWKIAYDKALAGKNLAGMTRKQRRSIEAAAKAAADAAVAEKSEVVVNTTETVNEVVNETTEEIVEATVEITETVEEAPVQTADVEDVSESV